MEEFCLRIFCGWRSATAPFEPANVAIQKKRTSHMDENQSDLTFITEALPRFTIGKAYNFDLQAGGGTPPYSYEVTEGALPEGVVLESYGTISGTPTTEGDTTAFVLLTDTDDNTVTQAFDCEVK
jgi:hypothetical protein